MRLLKSFACLHTQLQVQRSHQPVSAVISGPNKLRKEKKDMHICAYVYVSVITHAHKVEENCKMNTTHDRETKEMDTFLSFYDRLFLGWNKKISI